MAKATRVFSTPPTNTDTTRRHLLTIAAGGAVAAAIPADARACPGHAADPIFAAIDRHKAAAAVWDAAVDVRASLPEGPEPMTDEQWEERDRLDDAEEDAREPLWSGHTGITRHSPRNGLRLISRSCVRKIWQNVRTGAL
jgi:hypothetical protein